MNKPTYVFYFLFIILALTGTYTAVADEGDQKRDDTVQDTQVRPDDSRATALVSRVHLIVNNPDEKRALIMEKLKVLGGFVVLLTDDRIKLKLPPAKLSEALLAVSAEGTVIEKTLNRQDLTLLVAELKGKLKSKLEVYGQLRAFFDDANAEGTLEIESEMNLLIEEIEKLKGRLRVIQEQSRWAEIEVLFRFQRRDRISYNKSRFKWLNTVSLERFVRGF